MRPQPGVLVMPLALDADERAQDERQSETERDVADGDRRAGRLG